MLRDELKALHRPSEDVTIPEWDGRTLRVRKLSTGAKLRLWGVIRQTKTDDRTDDGLTMMVQTVIACVTDTEDQPVFDAEKDVEWLKEEADHGAVERLWETADRLNGLSARRVDEAEKKSEVIPNGSSLSDSLSSSGSGT